MMKSIYKKYKPFYITATIIELICLLVLVLLSLLTEYSLFKWCYISIGIYFISCIVATMILLIKEFKGKTKEEILEENRKDN